MRRLEEPPPLRYLPEVAHPHAIFKKAGFELTYASPKGGAAPCDEGSIEVSKEDECCTKFLAADKELRSSTSICLKFSEAFAAGRDQDALSAVGKKIVKRLEEEGVALDIGAYRDAPAGLRVWGGATVSAADTAALLPWLDWAAS